jgi:pyridoxal/pyridoxine/pyridoxamine kinase
MLTSAAFAVAVCDPVLGDNGRLYVPQELVQIYKEQVIPHATLLTPNQFELELLTDCKVSSQADALRACARLHEAGVPTVVCTPCHLRVPSHAAWQANWRVFAAGGKSVQGRAQQADRR